MIIARIARSTYVTFWIALHCMDMSTNKRAYGMIHAMLKISLLARQ